MSGHTSLAGMTWIPGGAFAMGSESHYPEEAPVREAAVEGFWIDKRPVTNLDFLRFVKETGHVTVAEQVPDAADYPGAKHELLFAQGRAIDYARHGRPAPIAGVHALTARG